MNLIIGPNLSIEGITFESVPVEKISGLDFVLPSPDQEVVCCFPVPVAIKMRGQYELIPNLLLWKPDLNGAGFSALHCYVLPEDIDEKTLQAIRVTLETVHANRTLQKRGEVSKMIREIPHRREILEKVYGMDPIKHLSRLLVGNGYCKRHQSRLAAKGKKQGLASKVEVWSEVDSNDSSVRNEKSPIDRWNEFQEKHPPAWTFNKIVNAFPKIQQQEAKERLVKLIDGNGGDLMSVWISVRGGLKKKGLFHE